MSTYHIFNADLMQRCGLLPSQLKTGIEITVVVGCQGSEGPGCRGKRVDVPAGLYKIVSRKYFRAGTHTIQAV